MLKFRAANLEERENKLCTDGPASFCFSFSFVKHPNEDIKKQILLQKKERKGVSKPKRERRGRAVRHKQHEIKSVSKKFTVLQLRVPRREGGDGERSVKESSLQLLQTNSRLNTLSTNMGGRVSKARMKPQEVGVKITFFQTKHGFP